MDQQIQCVQRLLLRLHRSSFVEDSWGDSGTMMACRCFAAVAQGLGKFSLSSFIWPGLHFPSHQHFPVQWSPVDGAASAALNHQLSPPLLVPYTAVLMEYCSAPTDLLLSLLKVSTCTAVCVLHLWRGLASTAETKLNFLKMCLITVNSWCNKEEQFQDDQSISSVSYLAAHLCVSFVSINTDINP